MKLHQIDTGDLFGDPVFDLQARIDLEKVELVSREQEFDGPNPRIRNMRGDLHRGTLHFQSQLSGEMRGRSFFEHLLMAPLSRAVARTHRDHVLMKICGDLNFDVSSVLDLLLQEQPIVSKGTLGL